MVDVHSKKIRSYNMSKIKNANTKPELIVRKFLFSNGFRYRINVNKLPGKPDIVLSKYNTVVFVHGCFWHGHKKCKYFVLPKTRRMWWENKLTQNKIRDALNYKRLVANNWKVIVVYECKLKKDKRKMTLEGIIRKLKTD
jgi:DNA mismatch endonuclease, patch repair protein